jgi:hypothetical protein
MVKYFRLNGSEVEIKHYASKEELKENLPESTNDMHYCR